MIRKHVLSAVFVVVGAVLLAGIAAQLLSSRALAQAGQPGAAIAPAVDVGGAFTYQGLLQQNGVAFDGSCDLEFRLFDALTVGTQVGATQTKNGQAVNKGRFTSVLDFGASAFNGQARWLEIAARCPSGSGGFTTLSPRQPLTAAPYALSLQPGAAITGNASAGILNLTNSGSGNGLTVNSAATGVQVDSASGIGFAVSSAPRGVYVGSGSLAGMQVDQSDLGVFVANARNGFLAGTARENGVQVNSSVNGLRVLSASGNGVEVDSAVTGLKVLSASGNGVQVDSAGVGVGVDSTTGGGIFVRSAGTVGLQVQSALNGVQVDNATGIGVGVSSAANGVVVNAATGWAGFFNGPVFAKTCTGCAIAAFGINTGAAALAPGDIVAIQGARPDETTIAHSPCTSSGVGYHQRSPGPIRQRIRPDVVNG